jgi:hypothetical protein
MTMVKATLMAEFPKTPCFAGFLARDWIPYYRDNSYNKEKAT